MGVLPAREYSWHQKYLSLSRNDLYQELRAGHLAVIAAPFGYFTGGQWNAGFNPPATATAGAVHNEHITYTITGGSATVLTDFDAQVVCVGRGGNGQNWLSGSLGWRIQGYTRTARGAAGGGGGAVVSMVNRFRAGDLINVTVNPTTKITVNGATLLEAQTGETQVSYAYTSVDSNWRAGDPPAVALLAASGAGAPAMQTPTGGSSQHYASIPRSFVRPDIMGLTVHANLGGWGLGQWTPSTTTVVWRGGGGGGAGGAGPNTGAGGPGLSLPFWATPLVVAPGGPGGSNSGQGAPIPTNYGAGGAGGGQIGHTNGTQGVRGAVFIRYPLVGLPLAPVSLS